MQPIFSPSRVKTAGRRYRSNTATPEDGLVLENWRASHAYVLNTFQSALRNRARGKDVTVGQRLKRRPTIIDKLMREPSMQLSTMHDLAGCRLIFENQVDLFTFRTSLHGSKGMRHVLKIGVDDKYNYVARPKDSGYRGVHDVYEYRVKSVQGQKWAGLHIEIQYRTVHQHAWATAVEVADLVNVDRIKFGQAKPLNERFFQLASEIIARTYEHQLSCVPNLTNGDLLDEFERVDAETGMLSLFRNLVQSEQRNPFRSNTILIFNFDASPENQLKVQNFSTINEAVEAYNRLEQELAGVADVVFVRGENEASVRSAFRNYFSDTTDFVGYIDSGRELLRLVESYTNGPYL